MKGLRQHLALSLRLHFRNRMALLYGYLFPIVFLVAFWVLYRYEKVPLARHMGELLTVTVLGGACFGLPTTMVSERERGVWRRYRLAPIATGSLVASTAVARYIAVLTAGLIQLGIAMGFGMPLPHHPIELWLAFSFVTFAFIGLGLVIAMLADNVPAVQGLGQCIFLPMLIIGGVAVPLSSLPNWALHVSAFFPGRYAVDAMQACVTGTGLGLVGFNLLALALIGAAGCFAGAKLFRWESQQRFWAMPGKPWVALALAAWLGVGALAEARGRVLLTTQNEPAAAPIAAAAPVPPRRAVLPSPALSVEEQANRRSQASSTAPRPNSGAAAAAAPRKTAPAPVGAPAPTGSTSAPVSTAGVEHPQASICPSSPASWQLVTLKNIDDDLVFDRGLPPDSGIVTPIARDDEQPDPDVEQKLQTFINGLMQWPAGRSADPIQRVRNYLYAAGVPDVFQMSIERFVPWYVFDAISQQSPQGDLVKILYWIACHPDSGADPAVQDMRALGLPGLPADVEEVRNRAALYGVKLLGRLLGRIK
jgi:ABC-2 type transport system permease protein